MRPTPTNAIELKEPIDLIIEHIDPLGQGVAKIPAPDDGPAKIYFIPKTLPGEVINAKVEQKSKNLNFCTLLEVKQPSVERITPKCQHYDICPGCRFLHCSHDFEWQQKIMALNDQFQRHLKWDISEKIEPFKNASRFYYRNRIQLHYKLGKNPELGLKYKDSIISIPKCQLPVTEIREQLRLLYENNHWTELVPAPKKPEGHVEIEWATTGTNKEIKLRWNKPYAEEGFSQVNEKMNGILKNFIHTKLYDLSKAKYDSQKSHVIIDLFCGDGNLTKDLAAPMIVIGSDNYKPSGAHGLAHYLKLDLFEEEALGRFKVNYAGLKIPKSQPLALIIDPPRSGFNGLKHWIDELKPKYLIAVSCHYSTLIRDLKSLGLTSEQCVSVGVFDMFPGTYHLECCAIIRP